MRLYPTPMVPHPTSYEYLLVKNHPTAFSSAYQIIETSESMSPPLDHPKSQHWPRLSPTLICCLLVQWHHWRWTSWRGHHWLQLAGPWGYCPLEKHFQVQNCSYEPLPESGLGSSSIHRIHIQKNIFIPTSMYATPKLIPPLLRIDHPVRPTKSRILLFSQTKNIWFTT